MAEAVHVGGTSDPAAPAAARVTRWTPAAIVIAMAVALVAVIWAIFLFLCWQGFGTTLENAKIKVQGAADVMAAETTWMLGSAHAVLAQLAASAPLPADITADQKSVLDAALRPFPASTSLGIYDAAGTAWANAASPSLPASIADEDFFKVLEDGGDWTVSPQRADAATGRPVFVVAQRLGGAEFGGIVTLTISGEVLDGFWRPQKLGEDSTVSLIRLDGWLVGRYPPLKQTIAKAENGRRARRPRRKRNAIIHSKAPNGRAAVSAWPSRIVVRVAVASMRSGFASRVGAQHVERRLRRHRLARAGAAVLHLEFAGGQSLWTDDHLPRQPDQIHRREFRARPLVAALGANGADILRRLLGCGDGEIEALKRSGALHG